MPLFGAHVGHAGGGGHGVLVGLAVLPLSPVQRGASARAGTVTGDGAVGARVNTIVLRSASKIAYTR